VLTAAERLRAELGEEPKKAPSAARRPASGGSGDGLFTRANGVDTVAILDKLGINHQDSNRGEMATCPGCSEDGALVCKDGGVKCLHARCSTAGPKANPGFRTNVDLVALVQRMDPADAAKEICAWFHIEVPRSTYSAPDPVPPPGMFDDDGVEIDPYADPERAAIAGEPPAPRAAAIQVSALERYGVRSLQQMYQEVLRVHEQEKADGGFTTGVAALDTILGGLRRGNVALLAAMTSWGKSSFGVMVVAENLRKIAQEKLQGARPLVVSAEDPEIMFARRLLARDQRMNALRLRSNKLNAEDLSKLTSAISMASRDPIYLDVIGQPVEHVAEAIGAISKEVGVGVVICDYIQRLKTRRQISDRRNQVTYVGETISDAIKKANAAGLAFSQTKRVEGREPTMDDVKESGDLENMAEHVLIGWRHDQKDPRIGNLPPKRKVHVAKNKDGPTHSGWLELAFHELTASFTGAVVDARATEIQEFDNFGEDARGGY
jgi:hypothetical protein